MSEGCKASGKLTSVNTDNLSDVAVPPSGGAAKRVVLVGCVQHPRCAVGARVGRSPAFPASPATRSQPVLLPGSSQEHLGCLARRLLFPSLYFITERIVRVVISTSFGPPISAAFR